jgi:hypothetical protein
MPPARRQGYLRAIPSAKAFALLVCSELSDCDPPMCFSVSASSAALVALAAPFVAFSPVPSVAFLSSSLMALTMSYQIVVKLGIGNAKGAAVQALARRLARFGPPVVLIQRLLANCSLSQNTVEFHDPPATIDLGHAPTTAGGGEHE